MSTSHSGGSVEGAPHPPTPTPRSSRARVRETIAQAAGPDIWPRGRRQTLQGNRAAGGFYCEHPERTACGGTLAIHQVFFTGTPFGAVLLNQEPGLAEPDDVPRVGGRRAAPSRVGPALVRQTEPLSSRPAIFLLLSPSPRRLWVLPFLSGAGAGGVILKNQNC